MINISTKILYFVYTCIYVVACLIMQIELHFPENKTLHTHLQDFSNIT